MDRRRSAQVDRTGLRRAAAWPFVVAIAAALAFGPQAGQVRGAGSYGPGLALGLRLPIFRFAVVVYAVGSALRRPRSAGIGRARALGAALGLCAALCAGIGGTVAASGTGMTGEIRGTVVVDHTSPAHPVAGQPVRLEIVEPASTTTRDTTTNTEGRFSFSGLPVGGVRVFVVHVEYGGVAYTARAVLTSAAPLRIVPVSVFVVTSDRAAVHGTAAFAVIEAARGAIRMSVIQRLDNATDQAVATTDKDPLLFPLPAVSPSRAGEPVAFVDGWHDPHVRDGAITDAMPVLPGGTQVAYAVGIAPRTRTATLRWELPYGATDVEILTDPSVRVTGGALGANGFVTERGHRYARWSGGPVPAGGTISVRLEGLPVFVDRWPGMAAGGLAVVLACGLVLAARRGSVEAARAAASREEAPGGRSRLR